MDFRKVVWQKSEDHEVPKTDYHVLYIAVLIISQEKLMINVSGFTSLNYILTATQFEILGT